MLLGTMAVAILTAHRAEFLAALTLDPDDGLTIIAPCMYGLVLLAHGAGRLSLDRLIGKRCCVLPAEDATRR